MYVLFKVDIIYLGICNIMILRLFIEKCLFGIVVMGFLDLGGGERFFF